MEKIITWPFETAPTEEMFEKGYFSKEGEEIKISPKGILLKKILSEIS